MRTPDRVVVAALVLLACAAACARDDAADALAGGGLPTFTVDSAPVLVLEDDGTPEKLFAHVEARRLPDGRVAVADVSALTINVFRPDGTLDTTLARRGEGPGELRGTFALAARADTLYTFGMPPMSPSDVNVFAADRGYLARLQPHAPNARTLTVQGRLTSGQLLVKKGMALTAFGDEPESDVLIPDTVTYGLLATAGDSVLGDVAWLPPVVVRSFYTFPWKLGRMSVSLATYTLGPTAHVVASGDRVWLVHTDSARLRAFDGAGQPVVDTRLSLEPQPYDAAALDRAHARALATATRALDTAKANGLYDPRFRPATATAPLLSDARAGADGELWLRLFDVDETAPPRYVVVDREGREIARATLPAGLDVQQIGRDFVLGVRRDSLDVESVVEYALKRP